MAAKTICRESPTRLSWAGTATLVPAPPVSKDDRNSGDARSSTKDDERVRHVEHGPVWARSARNRARAARRLAKLGATPWWA